MEIKKSDSKGRLSIGEPGESYAVKRGDDGSIAVAPIPKLTAFPELGSVVDSPEAGIYVEYGRDGTRPTVLVRSYIPWDVKGFAEQIACVANKLRVSVAVKSGGHGGPLADALAPLVTRGVTEVHEARATL